MIPSKRAHLFVAAITHPGMSGKNNEDNYAISAHTVSEDDPTPSTFGMVADGVGGHKAGEVASEIAIETVNKIVAESTPTKPTEVLEFAVTRASYLIHQKSSADEDQKGMGSTCACVWVIGNQLYTASVGDSRIYLIRNDQIQQITTDHTWIQEAIEHGIITPEQAKGHPRAHVIRRYLGSKNPVEPDFRLRLHPDEDDQQAFANQGMELSPGDQLLLCSDGLTDLVEDREILAEIQHGKMEASLENLVALANERGGHDNITIVTLKVPEQEKKFKIPESKTQPIKTKPKLNLSWRFWVLIGVLLTVIIASVIGLYIYFSNPNRGITPTQPSQTMVQETLPMSTQTAEAEIEQLSPSITPIPSETPIRATYTPWPTSTP